jgi:hypothetical protein
MNKLDYKYELGELVQIYPTIQTSLTDFGFVIQRKKSIGFSYLYRIHWSSDGNDERWVPESDIKKYV